MYDTLQLFVNNCKDVLKKIAFTSIGDHYTRGVLRDSRAVIVFYCLDTEFCIYNCPSILIYRKVKTAESITYYILLTCTKSGFRNQGYASRLFDQFIEKIQTDNAGSHKRVSIVLSSLETAVVFYENYGFRWTRESLKDYPVLMNYEKYMPEKEYFILEKIIRE
jgi:ribosomal protein S18 acetylase RimI-like enzyme